MSGADTEFAARFSHCLGSRVVRGAGRQSALVLVKPHDYIRPGKQREGCQPKGLDGKGGERIARESWEMFPYPAPPPPAPVEAGIITPAEVL